MKFNHIITLLVLVAVPSITLADQEGPNEMYVTGNGPFYLKCIPDEGYGEQEKGKTLVYLAGTERNVSRSVSHYEVIKDVIGIVRVFEKKGEDVLSADPEYGFEIVLHDGRRLLFDIHTGKKVKITDNIFTKRK